MMNESAKGVFFSPADGAFRPLGGQVLPAGMEVRLDCALLRKGGKQPTFASTAWSICGPDGRVNWEPEDLTVGSGAGDDMPSMIVHAVARHPSTGELQLVGTTVHDLLSPGAAVGTPFLHTATLSRGASPVRQPTGSIRFLAQVRRSAVAATTAYSAAADAAAAADDHDGSDAAGPTGSFSQVHRRAGPPAIGARSKQEEAVRTGGRWQGLRSAAPDRSSAAAAELAAIDAAGRANVAGFGRAASTGFQMLDRALGIDSPHAAGCLGGVVCGVPLRLRGVASGAVLDTLEDGSLALDRSGKGGGWFVATPMRTFKLSQPLGSGLGTAAPERVYLAVAGDRVVQGAGGTLSELVLVPHKTQPGSVAIKAVSTHLPLSGSGPQTGCLGFAPGGAALPPSVVTDHDDCSAFVLVIASADGQHSTGAIDHVADIGDDPFAGMTAQARRVMLVHRASRKAVTFSGAGGVVCDADIGSCDACFEVHPTRSIRLKQHATIAPDASWASVARAGRFLAVRESGVADCRGSQADLSGTAFHVMDMAGGYAMLVRRDGGQQLRLPAAGGVADVVIELLPCMH